MKNIHIVPTDKPSRLYENTGALVLDKLSEVSNDGISINQHIYITSDEEIKEGDWYFFNVGYAGGIKKADKRDIEQIHLEIEPKKIILTTDQDLIKDGVQAIDDEFLEWFVKNPSCEEVEVEKVIGRYVDYGGNVHSPINYKITIPKEEPKQTDEKGNPLTYWGGLEESKQHFIDMMKDDEELGLYEEPKQETLEEAAKKYSDDWEEITGLDYDEQVPNFVNKLDFINGAKWQQERSYSENEVLQLLLRLQQTESYDNLYEWFEQFKKK
jgi:hypothetical protein